MAHARHSGSTLQNVSRLSTLLDAAYAFLRGRPWAGAILLGATALSGRVPGIGVVASVLVRLVRRLR
jgi:hypothetical protein